MKKLILLFVATAFTISQMLAQESTFKKGDKVVNLGIGFGSGLYTGSYYSTSVPPLSGSFEIGVKDGVIDKGSIGVGGYVGYSAHKWDYGTGWGWKYSNFFIGARGSFHYPLVNKLDTYTGLFLGYNAVTAKEFGSNPILGYSATSSGIVYAWYVGGRYYFSEAFAGMLELGVGITYLNIGVALKF